MAESSPGAGFNDPQEINGTLSADATPAEAISPVADQDWPAYGRNQEGQRFFAAETD